MRKYIIPAIVGVGIAAVLAARTFVPTAAVAPWPVVQALPPGVTLIEPDRDFLHTRIAVRSAALGNARGEKLYVLDVDMLADKSACTDTCAATWAPFAAPAEATAAGDWSLVVRGDGSRQWAYQHKPLYRPANKVDPVMPDNAKDPGHQTNASEDQPTTPVVDWHIARFTPEAAMTTPLGIGIQDVSGAGGYGLVDRDGMTLYAFDGDARKDQQACFDKACTNHWRPLRAPELMQPTGDFSLVVRGDGTRQWAYEGESLYTFDGDLVPGDVTGQGTDKKWRPAVITSYFTPADVVFETSVHGMTLATRDGKTLYTRNPFLFQAGGFDIYQGSFRPYSKGKILGTKGCDAACLTSWHPFIAPAAAMPSGFWEIITRDDGTRQWMYKGYALYTFAGDKNRGDVNGNNIFDLIHDDDGPYTMADAGRGGGRGSSALFWHIAMP